MPRHGPDYVRILQTPLAGWSARYESLRRVTTDDLAAALTPLTGVHALRPADICALALDDVGPAAGTLLTRDRIRPLDRLTAGQLRAWLQARHARCP